MPEIKNQRALAKVAQHVIDFAIKGHPAGQKCEWINITLHRDT